MLSVDTVNQISKWLILEYIQIQYTDQTKYLTLGGLLNQQIGIKNTPIV